MIENLLRIFPRVRELEALVDNCCSTTEVANGQRYEALDKLETTESELRRVSQSLQESESRASTLEDRLNAAYEDRQRLWDLVQTSLAGERTAYQSGLNLQWQKEGFGAPYPDAPQMPLYKVPREVENSFIPRSLTGSERVAQGTREFMAMFQERLANQSSG